MDEAKRLREEATAMEVKESNEEPVAGGGDTSDRAVTASATAQQFSALFPAARKLVADALAAPPRREPASPATTATDSAQSPSSSTATTAAAGAGGKTNGTYVSILSDRGEAAARKALVDKISGEGARSSDGATDGTVAPGRNFFFLEDDEVGGVDGDDDRVAGNSGSAAIASTCRAPFSKEACADSANYPCGNRAGPQPVFAPEADNSALRTGKRKVNFEFQCIGFGLADWQTIYPSAAALGDSAKCSSAAAMDYSFA
jgi:hypothetical protein